MVKSTPPFARLRGCSNRGLAKGSRRAAESRGVSLETAVSRVAMLQAWMAPPVPAPAAAAPVQATPAAGETNAPIGARHGISEGTVKSHLKHNQRKQRAPNRAEAVSKYMRLSARAGEDAFA